jgi:hypothetical protein
MQMRSGDQIIWLEALERGDRNECDVHGPPSTTVSISLHALGVMHSLTSAFISDRGTARLAMRVHVDALDRSGAAAGQFQIAIRNRSFHANLWFGSTRRLINLLDPLAAGPLPGSDTIDDIFLLPDIGAAIAGVAESLIKSRAEMTVAGLTEKLKNSGLSPGECDRLISVIAAVARLAHAFDRTNHDVPADVAASAAISDIIDWLAQPTAHPPAAIDRLKVERWKNAAYRIRQRFIDASEAESLILDWREGVLTGRPSAIVDRPGGSSLTDAARRHVEAMQQPSAKLRNQALNTVVISLQSAQQDSSLGDVVNGLASILEQLARRDSGRPTDASGLNEGDHVPALARAIGELKISDSGPSSRVGLRLGDIFPWSWTAVERDPNVEH